MTSINSAQAEVDLAELEHQLLSSESQVPNLVDGTEKEIEWFQGKRQKTTYSIVYIHGFSATRKEISPIPEALAKKLEANIFFTRLRGHGRDGDAMLDGNIEAWLEDTQLAYEIGRKIGHKVIVMGTSTGATLTTWLSAQSFAEDLFANIIVSPNFALANDKTWIMQSSIGMWLVKKLQGVGFSLDEIKEFLVFKTCSKSRLLVEQKSTNKIVEIKQKITELQSTLKALEKFSSACGSESNNSIGCDLLDCFDNEWKCCE